MDWSKAKNVLIIAFIVTNIFLAHNLQVGIFKPNQTQSLDREQLFNVERYLNNNGINLDTNIPQEVISLPILVVKYKNFNSGQLADRFLGEGYEKSTESLDISNSKREIFKKDNKELIIEGGKKLIYKNTGVESQNDGLNELAAIKISNDFLKEYQLAQDDITLGQVYYGIEEHIDSELVYKLVYNQTYENKFLGESYIHVYINHRGIIALEAMLLEYEKTQQQRKNIIPATDALMRAMNMILQENQPPVYIEEIEIGYYFSPADYTESDWKDIYSGTAFPSWKITIQNGKTYFIEAYKN